MSFLSISAEAIDAPWGGIGRAVALMREALALSGFPMIALEAVHPSRAGGCRVGLRGAGNGLNAVYSSPDRSALRLSEPERLTRELLARTRGRRRVLLVHNEELAPAGADLARRIDALLVHCFHGDSLKEHGVRPDTVHAEGLAAFMADRCIAMSRSSAERVSECYGVECVPVPLPLSLLRAGCSPSGERERQSGLIFAAGRAVPQKGFDVLPAIASMLPPGGRIVVALGHGDVRYEGQLRRALQVSNVVTIPWQPVDGVRAWLRSAEALVVPSSFEPLGLIAAEGFAEGCPVVASNVGGLGQLVSWPAGLAVQVNGDVSRRASNLAAAVNRILGNGEYAEAMRVAQWERLRTFSADRFVSALLRVTSQ